MLVFSRKVDEEFVIVVPPGEYKTETRITVKNVELRSDKVRLGIDAPPQFPVHRSEVMDRIDNDHANGKPNPAGSEPSKSSLAGIPAQCVHAWVFQKGSSTSTEFAGPHLKCRKCGELRHRSES